MITPPAPSGATPNDALHESALFETALDLPHRRRGKVRDLYRLPGGDGDPPRVLVIATDRISAFDVVMPTPIPGKGRLLTAISARWFEWLRARRIVADHLIETDVDAIEAIPPAARGALRGRTMLCRAAAVIPVECVARGHLAGSGWSEYSATGRICGAALPAGLREGDRLPEPIFTPASKAEEGHDENIGFAEVVALVGEPLAHRLRDLTLAIYSAAAAHALERGLILADTKFEFGFAIDADGRTSDELLLVDEVLTPDSSRYWPAESWRPGAEQPSFDKQFLREWLLGLVRSGAWTKQPPGPELPGEIVERTLERYLEAHRRLWGG
ncbi:MAG TPA: phosphoribosylaminoimidazolesuccinocarboxamide synthase [Phycisphaerales bacterium]|nr:phosphoribosylaminoimidazolesuccinocarboxamide synthase [Phycisphaerales bacterium]HMP36956.1 phosphoribosylaminoimidazolesuccinocarboxamide synthase [Phycisphaerales bacterium]